MSTLAQPSRRAFLQSGGAIVVSFAFPGLSLAQTSTPKEKLGLYEGLDSWLAVAQNGDVTVFCGKVELGTGVTTGLSQIVAEELDFPVARIRMIMGDTAIVPDQGTTTGSKTTQMGGPQLRQAAAEARAVLNELAAAKLGVSVDSIAFHDGVAFVKNDPAKKATLAELIGGRRFDRKMTKKVKGKAIADYAVVGQPVPRVDLPAKITGSFNYVHNLRLPGMLHGRVVRPPMPGARLLHADAASVKKLGAQVVTRSNFVGVVAVREEVAIAAAHQLKVEWELPPDVSLGKDIHHELRTYPSEIQPVKANGDVGAAFPQAAKIIKASYCTPFQMHASIGPSCGVADVRDGAATVWCGTQHSFGLVTAVAKVIGIPAEKVRVAWTEASGCYGHNGADDSAVDAALLSQAVGKPVRVQWMRHDEHGWEPKGPAMVMDLAAGLDGDGKIIAWDFINITSTHSTRPRHQPGNTLGGQLTGHAAAYELSNGGRNADVSYEFPNKRVQIRYHQSSPLRPSALRGLSGYQNTFANETFIDELAAAANADAVAFRLAYLKDERARAVVTAVAKLAKWEKWEGGAVTHGGGNIVSGRGIAYCQYENENAYAAVIAEVEVNRASGEVSVKKMFAAHDCGLIVNPDGVRNQVEGCLVQGMSRALFEEVSFARGATTSLDWAGYPIARFADIPQVVEVELINRLDKPSVGAGEGATCPVAAAIGNAIFNASGARLRQYPFKPERVKLALAHALANAHHTGAVA